MTSWLNALTAWFSTEDSSSSALDRSQELEQDEVYSTLFEVPNQWVGHEALLKKHILEIPRRTRYFDISVPEWFRISFRNRKLFTMAANALKENLYLARRRFELVPRKLNQKTFWNVYFYIIYVIKSESPETVADKLDEVYASSKVVKKQDTLKERIVKEGEAFKKVMEPLIEQFETFNRRKAAERLGHPVDGEVPDETELENKWKECVEMKKSLSKLLTKVYDGRFLQRMTDVNVLFTILNSQHTLFEELIRPQEEVVPSYTPKILSSKYSQEEATFTTDSQRAQLAMTLPIRFSRKDWHLVYSTKEHGISLNTLYRNCSNVFPIIILIKTSKGHILGCFCGDSVHLSTKYYGNGETFVFHFPNGKLKSYHWTRKNEHFIYGSSSNLSIGGGSEGGPAIQLYNELQVGRTRPCITFNSPSLVMEQDLEEGDTFKIEAVECYTLQKVEKKE